MSTHILYVFSFLACIMAAYLYLYSDSVDSTQAAAELRYDYWAKDIVAVQTNELGQADMRLDAQELAHDPIDDKIVLKSVTTHMQTAGEQPTIFKFSANTASWQRPIHQLILQGDVMVSRVLTAQNTAPVSASNSSTTVSAVAAPSELVLTTQQLRADTRHKTIASDQPVTVTMNQSNIRTQTMRADLTTGEYEFEGLQARFSP